MAVAIYDNIVLRKRPIARALVAANLCLGAMVIIAWEATILSFLDPLSWAAHRSFGPSGSLSSLFEPPVFLFWFVPAIAVGIGWLAMRAHKYKIAVAVMLAPVIMGLLVFVLYCFLPDSVR